MATPVLTLALRTEADLSHARSLARDLATLLQLDPQEQINVSEAVGRVGRLAVGCGRLELAVMDKSQAVDAMTVTISGVSGSALSAADDAPRVNVGELRQLVDRVDVSERDGVLMVRLTALAGPDASIPGIEELQIVLESLARYETERQRRVTS